jgi:hypothetical protein
VRGIGRSVGKLAVMTGWLSGADRAVERVAEDGTRPAESRLHRTS